MSQPNFLFIQSDQFRYDLVQSVQEEMARYDGKTHIRTPNLDRLRREGVYFKRAYTQCAVCAPARSTFRTGCTLERHGGQSNDLASKSTYDLDAQFKNKIEADVTFEQILVENKGYVAEHYGKWHMPEIFNWSQNGLTRVMQYNDFNFVSNTPLFNNSNSSLDYDNKLASVAGGLSTNQASGMQRNTYSRYPYVTDRIDTRYGLAPYSTLSVLQPDQQGRDTLPANRTPSYFDATASLAALDRLATNPGPFILTTSFHNPHAPMVATGLYYDYYKALENGMFLPPNLDGNDMANSAWSKYGDPDYQDPAKVKEWMVSYYALCEEVDHYVGLLLDKLDEKGLASNTLVIFVADHGEMLGAHGMREKNVFLEESAHVPMLMRFPGRITAGTTVEETVATLDCFATILDYLGASAYDHGDGRSLRRFIERQNYNPDFDDEAIVTEWDFRDPLPDGSGGLTRTLGGESNFLCKKGPWKLILTKKASSTRLDMLYNLETDPYEVYNYVGNNGMTASDAAIGKAEHLKCLLIEWMQRMDGPNRLYSDPVYNAGEGMGDIAEITARRKWKTLNIWVSDTAVEVGLPVNVAGQLTRNEYIYLGRTTAGTLNVSSITVQGADAGRFQLSEFTSGSITNGGYKRVKLTYHPAYYGQPVSDARIVISHDAGANRVIELSAATVSNSPPTITSTPVTAADVGSAYSYTLAASDFENDPVIYSSVTLPAWLNFNTNTAVLSGLPSAGDTGAHPVVLRVSDPYGSTDQHFTVWVSTAGNDAPVITSLPNTGVIENQNFSYTVAAEDPDGDSLTYGAPTKPSWLNFNAGTRVLSGTPTSTNVGFNIVALAVSDGTVTVTQQFNVAVFPTPVPANLVQNGSFESGGTAPTYWTLGGTAVGSTTSAQDGSTSIRITPPTSGASAKQTIPIQSGTTYTLSVWISTIGVTGATAVFDTFDKYDATCQFLVSGTQGWTKYTGSFTATNTSVTLRMFASNTNFSGTAYYDNVVLASANASNMAPVITSVPLANVNQDATYRYTLLAADAEGSALTCSAITVPAWLSFNPVSRVLSGTPTAVNVGSHPVTLRVSDGAAASDQSFSIEVIPVVAGYDAWAEQQSEVIGPPNDDYDDDLRSNLYEYALNGNPTDPLDKGVEPTFMLVGNSLKYIHVQRRNAPDLIYSVETATNFFSEGWAISGASAETNISGGAYDVITNSLTISHPQCYIRLKITKP
ncbi:MAG: sulfatase-like hydrolase/transferase [Verrucomicrobia bacterium]|nr:sulfatase-like hydrolase/transferase [Verrucomicrobiota bacterium]